MQENFFEKRNNYFLEIRCISIMRDRTSLFKYKNHNVKKLLTFNWHTVMIETPWVVQLSPMNWCQGDI